MTPATKAIPTYNITEAKKQLFRLVREAGETGPVQILDFRTGEGVILVKRDDWNAVVDAARAAPSVEK